jgi:ribosomal protein S18 acetylase RimI-like enzyme
VTSIEQGNEKTGRPQSREFPTIHRAQQAADVTSINEFFNRSTIKNELHWFTHRDTLERAFEREDRQLFYAVGGDGELTAGLMVWCESRVLDEDEAQVRLVAVTPEYRHCGLGSILCQEAETFARTRDQETMVADVAAASPAVEFWTTLGYTETDGWKTDGGREMLRMATVL